MPRTILTHCVAAILVALGLMAGCATAPPEKPCSNPAARPSIAPPDPQPWHEIKEKAIFAHVLFDLDSVQLKPPYSPECVKLVVELTKHPQDTVLLEGHTCSTGDAAYNMALGLRRAEAVKAYLVQQGIAAERISTKSFGESEPVVPNDTPLHRQCNRRVEFDISIEGL